MFIQQAWSGKSQPSYVIWAFLWQALQADVQRADSPVLQGLLQSWLSHAEQGSLWQLPTEQQVDAGVRAAVQTGKQHQDGKSGGWKQKKRRKEGETGRSQGFIFQLNCFLHLGTGITLLGWMNGFLEMWLHRFIILLLKWSHPISVEGISFIGISQTGYDY